MKKRLNNNGYALITVLLMITVFMVFAFSFFIQSGNSVKQNKLIEEKNNSVALAEMGIGYFENEIRNIYYSNYDRIKEEIEKQREEDIKNKNVKKDSDYIYLAVTKMGQALSAFNPNSKSIDDKPNTTINFEHTRDKNSYIQMTSTEIIVSFVSVGALDRKLTNIEAAMKIDFSDFLASSGKGGSGAGGLSGAILSGNEISDPGNLTACKNGVFKFNDIECQINGSRNFHQNEELEFEDSVLRVTESLVFGNYNKKDMNDSILYILGNLTTGNMNSLKNTNIHVNGTASIGQLNGNGFDNSIIEVLGSANFENMKMDNSKIYVGKAPAKFGNINGMKNSTIFVNSDAEISGVDLKSNSTICINGNLKIGHVNNNSGGSSKIYARSTKNNNGSVITDSTAFENACGGNSSVKWGDPSISVDYDYKY